MNTTIWSVICDSHCLAHASERLAGLMVQTRAEEQLWTENCHANRLPSFQSSALAVLRASPSRCSDSAGSNARLTRVLHLELSSQILMCELHLRYQTLLCPERWQLQLPS